MPTSSQSVPATWTLIQSGPATSIAFQVYSGRVIYRIDTATPAETEIGHPLAINEGNSIGLEASENLYAKSVSTNLAQVIVTV